MCKLEIRLQLPQFLSCKCFRIFPYFSFVHENVSKSCVPMCCGTFLLVLFFFCLVFYCLFRRAFVLVSFIFLRFFFLFFLFCSFFFLVSFSMVWCLCTLCVARRFFIVYANSFYAAGYKLIFSSRTICCGYEINNIFGIFFFFLFFFILFDHNTIYLMHTCHISEAISMAENCNSCNVYHP